MKPGSVLVDVAIDQGGCFETSQATTHADPTYVVDGVVHYCVANMPGAWRAPRPSRSTTPRCRSCLALADKGWKKALADDAASAQRPEPRLAMSGGDFSWLEEQVIQAPSPGLARR
jgi:alanine dehydrogenase